MEKPLGGCFRTRRNALGTARAAYPPAPWQSERAFVRKLADDTVTRLKDESARLRESEQARSAAVAEAAGAAGRTDQVERAAAEARARAVEAEQGLGAAKVNASGLFI